MSTQFRIGAVMILFSVSCLGCGSKEAEGVPPGVNLPAPPERDNGAKAGLALAVQPEIVKVTPGGTAKVLVTAERKGFEGPIVLELSNLPANVSMASKATIAADAKQVEIIIIAAKDADVGEKADVRAMVAANPPIISPPFTIRVEKAAEVSTTPSFKLKVDPELVKITQGDKIKVRVSALRDGYDGPIVVELANMPGQISGGKGTIAAGEKDVVLELTADPKAAAGETKGATALGNNQTRSEPFTIAIMEASALFELRLTDEVIAVKQGEKAKLDLTIDRKTYDGPVTLELSNLPHKVTMNKVTVPAGQLRKALEIVADPAAAEGRKTDVIVVASMPNETKTILSKPFTIIVMKGSATTSDAAPFDLKVEPAEVNLKAGTKIKLRVTAVRQSFYQGPIVVELKNLHPAVKSGKLTLKEGQSFGDLELWALPNAPTGKLTEVALVGTASAAKDRQVTSASTLTVNVLGNTVVVVPVGPAKDAVWFDLKLEPKTLNIRPGMTGTVRVSVVRKNNFAGPVTVQLKGLPNSIQAVNRTGTIAKNKTYVDLQVFVTLRAPIGTNASVSASGTGTFNNLPQQQTSPAITINVVKK